MELFLNEWSASPLAKDGCFMKECDPFRFFGLLTKLKGKGVLKVYLPQEVRRRFFQTCFAMGDGELENLARSFKPLLETDRLGNALYAMSVENDSFCSIHAGISWKRQLPLVSLCHADTYCVDAVQGTIWERNNVGEWVVLKDRQEVGNLYDDNLALFSIF